jgi:cyclohexadieny/prephenate dehydrogenase
MWRKLHETFVHLFEQFTRTRAIRRGIIDASQDTPDADFGRSHGHED